MRTRFFAVCLVLAASVALGGCASVQQRLNHLDHILTQRNPGAAAPTATAPGLATNPTFAVYETKSPADETPECYSDIDTFVYREKGTTCNTYEAHIRGWSQRCVTDCDNTARLAEAIASAQRTCADFCSKKQCPGPRYSPPPSCLGGKACYAGSDSCDTAWPMMDYCMLESTTIRYNCQCTEF